MIDDTEERQDGWEKTDLTKAIAEVEVVGNKHLTEKGEDGKLKLPNFWTKAGEGKRKYEEGMGSEAAGSPSSTPTAAALSKP
ncbi:unnamed protein product [Camellia sinensis]